jgi:hypothetical protein
MRFAHATALAAYMMFGGATAAAQQANKDDEGVAVVELGAAVAHDLKDGGASVGPTIAVEVTPIEKWLELELGVTPLFRKHHAAEWSADLLFKKPWTLSKKVEFMLGVGPEWVHTKEPGARVNSVAGEAVLDFMFWPSGRRRFGWYVEPAFDYSFARGHERSIGVSGGFLISIP